MRTHLCCTRCDLCIFDFTWLLEIWTATHLCQASREVAWGQPSQDSAWCCSGNISTFLEDHQLPCLVTVFRWVKMDVTGLCERRRPGTTIMNSSFSASLAWWMMPMWRQRVYLSPVSCSHVWVRLPQLMGMQREGVRWEHNPGFTLPVYRDNNAFRKYVLYEAKCFLFR